MRFPDNEITYGFNEGCDDEKMKNAREAFLKLQQKTILEFKETSENSQILIFCSDISPNPSEKGYFVAGEGGPTEVINTTLYGAILSGKLSLFRNETCDNPNIAIHEILHVLGFKHNDDPKSILYPTLECNQKIDDYLIEDINKLYSVKGLAELKIIKVDAVKTGRYLSFYIEIINRGLAESGEIVLSVHSGDKFTKEFSIEDMGIGIKKTLNVTNLKIPHSTSKISFYIDEDNFVPEISEDNNWVELIILEES
jgi:hypothetical protein